MKEAYGDIQGGGGGKKYHYHDPNSNNQNNHNHNSEGWGGAGVGDWFFCLFVFPLAKKKAIFYQEGWDFLERK